MSPRAKGRPPRGSGEAGREKVLEAARAYLRSHVQHSVSRQDIARFAGVTPALTTYYFSNKSDLLLAATLPVLREAIDAVDTIVHSKESFRDRLKQLISLFIGFSAQNGRILDVFIEASLEAGDQTAQAAVLEAFGTLQGFFAEGAEAGEWVDFDPTFFIFAVWGMCKFVGEPPMLPVQMFGAELDQKALWLKQADLIVELLTNGIAARS